MTDIVDSRGLSQFFELCLNESMPQSIMLVRVNLAREVVRLSTSDSLNAESTLIETAVQRVQMEFPAGKIIRYGVHDIICVLEGDVDKLEGNINQFVRRNSPFEIDIEQNTYYPKLLVGVTRFGGDFGVILSTLEYACNKAGTMTETSYVVSSGEDSGAQSHIELRKGMRVVRQAIAREELGLFAQPVVSLSSDSEKPRCELLLRHYHDNTIEAPGRILDFARFNRFLHDVDMYVVELLCQRFTPLFGQDGCDIESVSINISGQSFSSPGFSEQVVALFRQYGVPSSKVVLEITEDIANLNIDSSIEKMKYFKKHGFKLALDDIGVGSSNFSNLRLFPVDIYKIDRSYSENILQDAGILKFVELIVFEAKRRNIKVIAEGIPCDTTLSYLKDIGVDYSQSFITGRPQELIPAPSSSI